MSSCTSIDPLITQYVDGELPESGRASVEEHLRRCSSCSSRAAAEAEVRDLMSARRPALTAEGAPPALQAQCREIANRALPPPAVRQPAAWRWMPLAVSGALVTLVAVAFLYQATHYSARLLAAELAADHVKCFAANRVLGTHDEPAAVESAMLSAFGWPLHLPAALQESGLELVGGRRCLYGEGKIAHLMYRERGRPVSIFMLPRRSRPEELVEILGHEAVIWSAGDRTFVLVARGSRAEVEQMALVAKAALK
jgi:anti-sigma factor RsiW